MRYTLVIAMFLFVQAANAQETRLVDGFSDKYFGKVYIADKEDTFSPGWVAIFDKKTNRQLIRVDSGKLTKTERNGKEVANVKELPYGEQSSIMYDDFNFDGRKDFAIMDGQNSCYGGPSFRVYLETGTGFRHDPAFTRLAQDYCGMFEIDKETKRLVTITKSGCCWHQSSEFIVSGGRPVAVKIVEEGLSPNGLLVDYVEKTRVGGRLVATKYGVLRMEDIGDKVVYSADLDGNKKMRLINYGERLSYAFTGPDEKVELLYDGKFDYSKASNALAFTNGKIRYEITAEGIVVKSAQGDRKLAFRPVTSKGSLAALVDGKIENLTIR